MIIITEKEKGCGCCPKNSITMKPEFEGFLYLEVDKGLTSYLKTKYENLLTIEVICHSTPLE